MFISQFGLLVFAQLWWRFVVKSRDLTDDLLGLLLLPHRQQPPGGLRCEGVEEEGEEY